MAKSSEEEPTIPPTKDGESDSPADDNPKEPWTPEYVRGLLFDGIKGFQAQDSDTEETDDIAPE